MEVYPRGFKPFTCDCPHCIETKEEIKSIQKSQANLRKDLPKIIHDCILDVLDHRARKTWV